MQTSGSNLRKTQSELDVTAGRVTSLEKSIKETEWIENADTALKSLEDQQSNLQKTKTQISKLTDIIDKITQFQTEIDTANEIIHDFRLLAPKYEEAVQQQTTFQRITSLIDSYPNIAESLPLLQSLKQTFQHANNQKTQYDSLVNILFNVPDIQEFPDLTPLRNLFENLYNQKSQYDKLSNLILQNIEEIPNISPLAVLLEKTTSRQKQSNRLSELIDQLTDMTNQYNETHCQLQESEKDLHEQLEGICPICGQAI
jgi:DNA repair exonuclease SbcCD ATPase subunit